MNDFSLRLFLPRFHISALYLNVTWKTQYQYSHPACTLYLFEKHYKKPPHTAWVIIVCGNWFQWRVGDLQRSEDRLCVFQWGAVSVNTKWNYISAKLFFCLCCWKTKNKTTTTKSSRSDKKACHQYSLNTQHIC